MEQKINNGGRISKYHQYLVLSLVKNIFVLFENKKKSVYYTYGIFKLNNPHFNTGISLEWTNGRSMPKCVREI